MHMRHIACAVSVLVTARLSLPASNINALPFLVYAVNHLPVVGVEARHESHGQPNEVICGHTHADGYATPSIAFKVLQVLFADPCRLTNA